MTAGDRVTPRRSAASSAVPTGDRALARSVAPRRARELDGRGRQYSLPSIDRKESDLRITGIDCHVLVQPAFDTTAASSAQDDIVVEIHTDEGIYGDRRDRRQSLDRARVHRGSRDPQHGSRPARAADRRATRSTSRALWERLYVGSAMNGRRGAVINAIGALDIALHDLRGKALGKPCYELLGGAVRDSVMPVRVAPARDLVIRGVPRVDGRLGTAGRSRPASARSRPR